MPPTVTEFIAWFRREELMPDAVEALNTIWAKLEQVKAMAAAAQERVTAQIDGHQVAINLLREELEAYERAEQATWDAQSQFAAIKRALGLE